MVSPVLGGLVMSRTDAGAAVSTVGRNRSELAQDQLPFFLLSCNPLEFCFDCSMRVTSPGPV